jgi:hypothetical protein
MNGKKGTIPEVTVDSKPEKVEVCSHSNSENWRLSRAIDFLLDYIFEQEITTQVYIKEPECRADEPDEMWQMIETDELTI